jgi:hypothetical protein
MGGVVAVDKDKLKTGMIRVNAIEYSMDIDEECPFKF